MRFDHKRGQATVEMALVLVVAIVPLTLGLIGFAELTWTYHALTTLTRDGARYAATHCWTDDAGSNVVAWMQANSPPFIDRTKLITGQIQIQVSYWTHDSLTHQSIPFTCGGGCGSECIPDAVTVRIAGYQITGLLVNIGLQPLQVPPFSTTVEMQSAGGNAETAISVP